MNKNMKTKILLLLIIVGAYTNIASANVIENMSDLDIVATTPESTCTINVTGGDASINFKGYVVFENMSTGETYTLYTPQYFSYAPSAIPYNIPEGTYQVKNIVIEGTCNGNSEFRANAQGIYVGFTISYSASSSNHLGLYCW
jgi:hypothetical protein